MFFRRRRRAPRDGFRFRREVRSRRLRRGKRGKRLRLETPPPPVKRRVLAVPAAAALGARETAAASPRGRRTRRLARRPRRPPRRLFPSSTHLPSVPLPSPSTRPPPRPPRRRSRRTRAKAWPRSRLGVARSATRRRLLARVKHPPRGPEARCEGSRPRARRDRAIRRGGIRGSARGRVAGPRARGPPPSSRGSCSATGPRAAELAAGPSVRGRARLGSVINARGPNKDCVYEPRETTVFVGRGHAERFTANKNGKNSKMT